MRAMLNLPAFLRSSDFLPAAILVFLLLTGIGLTRSAAQSTPASSFLYTSDSAATVASSTLNSYLVNAATGSLSVAPGAPFTTGYPVIGIAAHPSGKFVYAVASQIDPQTVVGYSVDAFNGSLTPVPGSPYAAGPRSFTGSVIAMDPAGKFLYVGGNQLWAFAINADTGSLTPVPGSPFSTITSAVAVDPSGKYLVEFNGSGVQLFTINGATGAVAAAGPAISGCGGSVMAFEPFGHFLYAVGAFSGVAVCSFNSGTGTMAPVSGSPFFPGAGILNGLTVHPSGAFLYASIPSCVPGSSRAFYGFLIDPVSGALTQITGSPFSYPITVTYCYNYGVAADASGKFIYAAEANNGVAAYTVTSTGGALSHATNSFFGPGASVVATGPNAVSTSATLTGVQIVPLAPQISTITLGKPYQFTLQGSFSDGSTGFLTSSASWSTSNAGVATVAGGLATSTGYGATTITATVNGHSASTILSVVEPPLTSIAVTPQPISVYQGTAVQLNAAGTYADGESGDVTGSVTWVSSDNTIATVSAAGLVQTIQPGSVTITAKLQGISGTSLVTVVAGLPTAAPYFSLAGGTYYAPQVLTLSDTAAGAIIHFTYTPKGTTPTTASTVYTGPITINMSGTVEAIAIAPGHAPSAAATKAYVYTVLPPAATPFFNLAGGTYHTPQLLTLTDTTPGAAIHYTTNGSKPTATSTLYTGPITIASTETIQAVAIATGYLPSAQASKSYIYAPYPPAAAPAFSLGGGTYDTPQKLTLSDATPGATIYYTIDGTRPTTSSAVYSAPITIAATETVEAAAIATGYALSPISSKAYTYSPLPLAAAPYFSLAGGQYVTPQMLTLTDATPGATIYYTTNGTMPTTGSTPYSGPIAISTSETVIAIAVASGYTNSNPASKAYVIP